MSGAERVERAVRAAAGEGRPAVVAYLTAGFPSRERFADVLLSVAEAADVVEIGVPFTDPMADGVTIQRASERALRDGVSVGWILRALRSLPRPPAAPLLLMSYLNPLLAHGVERLAAGAPRAGVSGLIVPDLPLEESALLREAAEAAGLALVQLVSPVTPAARLSRLQAASRGFLYAVTVTGITGSAAVGQPPALLAYLDRVRAGSPVPVCAGFGIRSPGQVRALAPHTDGVVIGSALLEVIERGEDPAAFLESFRPGRRAPGAARPAKEERTRVVKERRR